MLSPTARRARAPRWRCRSSAPTSTASSSFLGQLCNALEPRLAWYFSSASSGLRVLLTPALQQQLRADHEAAAALCRKTGMQSCKELREAEKLEWLNKRLTAADLGTLGMLGSVLLALEVLILAETSGVAGPDGVQRLVVGLGAGALPALTFIGFGDMHMGDAGASALAAALGRGALPRLKILSLINAAIGGAALVALAPALRRRPALLHLGLGGSRSRRHFAVAPHQGHLADHGRQALSLASLRSIIRSFAEAEGLCL